MKVAAKKRISQKQSSFDLKTTILKNIIREDRTETIKLRTIRTNKRLMLLPPLDPVPIIFDNRSEREAKFSNFFSIPGRLRETNKKMFQVIFEDDEALVKNREYAFLIGYTIEEKLEDLFIPPKVIVQEPVGSERLTVELHFPPNWSVKRDEEGKMEIKRLYAKLPGKKTEIDFLPDLIHYDTARNNRGKERRRSSKQIQAFKMGDKRDFGGGLGKTDWFRVVIIKPPQGYDIHLEWEWVKKGVTKPRVFLSYAREDKSKVDEIYLDLSRRGFDPWIDRGVIEGGGPWEDQIRIAIENSDFFIVILSKDSVAKDGFQQKEIEYALDILRKKLFHIFVIPVLLEKDVQVPEKLNSFDYVYRSELGYLTKLTETIQTEIEHRNRRR